MKLYKSLLASIALIGMTTALTGCQNEFDNPVVTAPEATMKANTTIADFKLEFMNENALQVPVKENGEHYIIHGRVISSDASGNIYKALVIQDETAALTFSINRASLYNYWHVGQELVIDLTDLWVGKYNNLLQIGWLGEPYNGVEQLTFVDFDIFYSHVEMNGFPKTDVELVEYGEDFPADCMYKIVMAPEELRNVTALSEECTLLMSQLVELREVEWVRATPGLTYAPFQESVNRYVQNESGTEKVCVRNSGYANFYNVELPAGIGNVSGILSWYGDGSSYGDDAALIPGWQMLLRGLYDVVFETKGTYEEPYTVAEAIENQNLGKKRWVEGIIVGSVVPGVSQVTSNDDINFTAADHIANNVVIAASASERDWTKCVVVALPQGTDLRSYVNLERNPQNIGKKLTVCGELTGYFRMPGIMDNNGTLADFELEGLVIREQTVVYESLSDDADGWVFNNVTVPQGGSYVWQWRTSSQYGNYLNGSGYVGGTAKKALSYAVSPEIDLSRIFNPYVTFEHAAKFQTTLRKLCKFCVREAGTSEWTELEIPNWPTAGGWTFASSGTISLEQFEGKKIQIAFKYESDTTGADTWEIKNLKLSGDK